MRRPRHARGPGCRAGPRYAEQRHRLRKLAVPAAALAVRRLCPDHAHQPGAPISPARRAFGTSSPVFHRAHRRGLGIGPLGLVDVCELGQRRGGIVPCAARTSLASPGRGAISVLLRRADAAALVPDAAWPRLGAYPARSIARCSALRSPRPSPRRSPPARHAGLVRQEGEDLCLTRSACSTPMPWSPPSPTACAAQGWPAHRRPAASARKAEDYIGMG